MTTKIPVELSSTPGIVDGSNATAITIDSSERVGIGTADNLERVFTVSTGTAKTSTSNVSIACIQTNESSANSRLSLSFTGGASQAVRRSMFQMEEDGVANSGDITLQPFGGSLVFGGDQNATFSTGRGLHMVDGTRLGFGTGNGTRPDFQISGDNNGLAIACGTGSDDADVLISTAGVMAVPNGIELGSGTDFTTANILDDYEYGTWTPTIVGSSTNPVYGTSVAAGSYIKVGDIVHASFLIVVTSVSNVGAGTKSVSGLPFTQNQSTYQQVGLIGYNDVWTEAVTRFYITGSNLTLMPSGVTQTNYTGDVTTGYFSGSITYSTSA